jgi:4-hydroxymandelate oxidase
VTGSPGFDDVVTIDQVIARARGMIDPGAYEWGAAGAGQGVTTARNTLALNRLALLPRVLRDVSTVDTRSSLVGVPLAIPVLLAPVAALGSYDLGDALTAAQAAAQRAT